MQAPGGRCDLPRRILPALTGLRDRGLRPGDTLTESLIQDALTMLDVCDRLDLKYTAEIIDYSQAVDYQTDCAVTFAGVSFYLS